MATAGNRPTGAEEVRVEMWLQSKKYRKQSTRIAVHCELALLSVAAKSYSEVKKDTDMQFEKEIHLKKVYKSF